MANSLTKSQFKKLRDLQEVPATFNFFAAVSDPESIDIVQFDQDFEVSTGIGTFTGMRGDYLFRDAAGGKMIVKEKLFKKIHDK